MTPDQAHAMSDAEVAAAIARWMKWYCYDRASREWMVPDDRHCTQNLNACHAAEKRLKEMGLTAKFKQVLSNIIHHDGAPGPYDAEWEKIHAPADKRARAILAAVQKGAKE